MTRSHAAFLQNVTLQFPSWARCRASRRALLTPNPPLFFFPWTRNDDPTASNSSSSARMSQTIVTKRSLSLSFSFSLYRGKISRVSRKLDPSRGACIGNGCSRRLLHAGSFEFRAGRRYRGCNCCEVYGSVLYMQVTAM